MLRSVTIDDLKHNADLFNLALYRAIRYMLDPTVADHPDKIKNLAAIRSRLFIDCAYVQYPKEWLLRWAQDLHFEWVNHLAPHLFKEYLGRVGKDNMTIEPAEKLQRLTGIELSQIPDSDGRQVLRQQRDDILVDWYHIAFTISLFHFLREWFHRKHDHFSSRMHQDFRKFNPPWPLQIHFNYFDEKYPEDGKRSRMVEFIKEFFLKEIGLELQSLTDNKLTRTNILDDDRAEVLAIPPTQELRRWLKTHAMYYHRYLVGLFEVLRRDGDLRGPLDDGLYILDWSFDRQIQSQVTKFYEDHVRSARDSAHRREGGCFFFTKSDQKLWIDSARMLKWYLDPRIVR